MECPTVKRTEYQLIDMDDEGFVTLMDDNGETRDDLQATDPEVAKQIREKVDAGEDALVCVLKVTKLKSQIFGSVFLNLIFVVEFKNIKNFFNSEILTRIWNSI